MKQKKAVILLSGGVDSAVALFKAKKQNRDCHSLFVSYGQKTWEMEARKSELLARTCGVGSHIAIYPDWLPRDSFHQSYVPGRNSVLGTIAASYAESIKASEVWLAVIGPNPQQRVGVPPPDTGEKFVGALQSLIDLGGLRTSVRVVAPFLTKSKVQVVREGAALGIDFGMTWSCWMNAERPCGGCGACIDRTVAFAQAGVVDPHWNPV